MTRSATESNPISSKNRMAGRLQTVPIAVIGIGSIFPEARTTQAYWDNILRKVDAVTEVPPSRWNIADYYDPDSSVPDKSYCKRGAFIPDVDFDPMEYGLPPNILEVTDVSQLISLVVAKEALEDAGYGEDRDFDRAHTGCVLGFVGTSSKLFTPLMTRLQYPVWEKVLRSSGLSDSDTNTIIEKIKSAYVGWEENAFPGAIGNVVAGRICNRFDLGGVNCVVDAACASSLAALKMAVGELIEGRAYMMLTGGVDTDNSINSYMCFSKTPAFTKKENVRTFDAESSGMMVGEGLGMILLKRLEDAERDGDRIYAVIKAVGTSSDGRFKSIYAPRPSGQAMALKRAYEEAGFSPASVGLIEAHGTGTMAGDPAEFQGLKETFGENNPRRQYIALGSVKSQIAHTKAAAGIASMIKTSLALYHKVLPPSINVTKPNPKFEIEDSPFYINTESRPWIRAKSAAPRRAGVSSFGFGGTNYHVVLEEYQAEHQDAYRLNTVAQPVLLSAADPAQLLAACRDALSKLQGEHPELAFQNLLQESRGLEIPQPAARVGFVAETAEEARQALQVCVDSLSTRAQEESWEHPKGVFYRRSGLNPQGKVVALFSGQGSQYLEMGRELAMNFPTVRDVFGAMDELFLSDGLEPLSSRVYPRPVFDAKERDALSDMLTRTDHAQPAIGSVSAALYKLLQQAGFQPDFVAGHSFGELTALWAAGVLSDEDYFALAKARGKAMAPPDDPSFDAGTMVAVKGEGEKVKEALAGDSEITLANWNSNNQVVIAGSKPAIERAVKLLNERGFQTIPLPVSAAFHTPLVGHAQKPFAKAIKAAAFHQPKVRVYSNSTGQAHSDDPENIRKVLAEHILKPVLFRDEIENIYAAGGSIFIEFGPKNVLTNLVGNILSGRPHLAVALNANAKKDSDRQLREAVVALRVAGLPLVNFDPFAVKPKVSAPRKKSPVSVKLNGGYYISEKTRSAFEKALNDGFRISLPGGQPSPAAAQAPAAQPPAVVPASLPEQPAQPAVTAPPVSYENAVNEYQAYQSETLRLHEQYLRTEEEYARAFAQLTQLQAELVSKGSGNLSGVLPLFESLERSMMRFHDHQAETLRVHQRYLDTQDQLSKAYGNGVQPTGYQAPAPRPVVPAPAPITAPAPAAPSNGSGNGHHAAASPAPAVAAPKPAPAPVAAAPVPTTPAPVTAAPVSQPAGLNTGALKAALLEIVSEKTGYPVETLEMDMDMEADLGIDSIKRVEILGAMQTRFPELPKIENTVLAELRTLGQIVSQMGTTLPTAAAGPAQAAAAAPAPVVTPAAATSGVSAEALTQALLAIVSEKTGYPTETLELNMDMEADLGIDSIKRVEILGAMQTQFPELPKVEANVLAELRTLGQIVNALGSVSAPAAAQPAVDAPAAAPAAPGKSTGPSVEALTAALLAIVSEKTGYPAETLELDMDMEADLGIDSIKRVEILGAMQTQFPELPKVEASVLAELRTLGQIVQQFSSLQQVAQSEPSAEVTGSSPFDGMPFDPGISQGVVVRKLMPPPDSLNINLPEKHVCLVTDDGTPLTGALVRSLASRSWPVVVLRCPQNLIPGCCPLPDGTPVMDLPEISEAALQAALSAVSEQYGPVAVFAHLAPAAQTLASGPLPFPEVEKALLKLVFLTAKHLKASLTSASQSGRSAFITITRMDGEFGLGGDGTFSPVNGGLFGLVKSINLEWDSVFCRAVDISPALPAEDAAGCILAELHDPNLLVTEVGYNQAKERLTLALAAVPVTGPRS